MFGAPTHTYCRRCVTTHGAGDDDAGKPYREVISNREAAWQMGTIIRLGGAATLAAMPAYVPGTFRGERRRRVLVADVVDDDGEEDGLGILDESDDDEDEDL